MNRFQFQFLLVVVTSLLGAQLALACGTHFGLRLLADRDRSLHGLWEGDFRTEAGRLVPAPPGMALPRIVDEAGEPVSGQRQRRQLQRKWLTAAQLGVASAMEAAPDAASAWEHGEGLPGPARAYLAGAVAWNLHRFGGADPDDDDPVIPSAPSRKFTEVTLPLGDSPPEDEAGIKPRIPPVEAQRLQDAAEWFAKAADGVASADSPWPILGQYMLARVQARTGSLGMSRADSEIALDTFARMRARVLAGEADPLGLAAASLSESAAVLLDLGRPEQAIRFYAEHAALGERDAAQSLLDLMQEAAHDEASLKSILAAPLGREVVVLYAYTHFPSTQFQQSLLGQEDLDENLDEDGVEAEPVDMSRHVYPDGRVYLYAQGVMEILLASMAKNPELAGADAARMAALAWRQGEFELAQRFHANATGPLAEWVGAKLALREGENDKAARHFAKAAAAFVPGETWGKRGEALVAEPHCQITAEQGVLALSQGEVRQSLELLLAAGAVYWLDAAYVAERVLPLEELVLLVDGFADNPALQSIGPHSHYKRPAWMWPEEDDAQVVNEAEWEDPVLRFHKRDVRSRLNQLLARRLMRSDQHEQAIERFADPKVTADARRYTQLLKMAEESEGRARAKSLFEAARLARRQGMQFLGYETEPDWFIHAGQYAESGVAERLVEGALPANELRWFHSLEKEAIQSQRDSLLPRFHYRLVAAELANRAADSLPTDSPAFSAVLCHATSWLLNREPGLARVYYQRYVDKARPVPYHAEFGRQCPTPDLG